MPELLIVAALLMLLPISFLILTYICYRMAFAVPKKHRIEPDELPEGEQYEAMREEMLSLIHSAYDIPFEEVCIQSEDGLRLCGRWYEVRPGAPVEILFHGYRSHALRDFSGGMQLGMACGCNVLLVDQRAHGKSEGRCLTFGIKERHDCLSWVNYVQRRCGADTEIVLTGISMGAATVMMASSLALPESVVGIIADSGYTSPSAIIRKVIGDLHYPLSLTYALVRIGARLYGHFDLTETSATEAVAETDIPILMIHGEDDRFVPCEMTRENFAACRSKKRLLTVPGAGHGISYMVDYETYRRTVGEFLQEVTRGEAMDRQGSKEEGL